MIGRYIVDGMLLVGALLVAVLVGFDWSRYLASENREGAQDGARDPRIRRQLRANVFGLCAATFALVWAVATW